MPPVEASGRELRAARRVVARRHHPDRGGDEQGYLRALAELDSRFRSVGEGPSPVVRRSARGRLGSLRHDLSRRMRRGRSRMPRCWPGAKRYAQL